MDNFIKVLALIVALVVLVSIFGTDQCEASDSIDWRAGITLGSEHWDDSFDYNQKNLGAYGCIEGWCAAYYENSYSKTQAAGGGSEYSTALYYQGTFSSAGPVEFNWSLGLVDGYKGFESDHEWRPFAGIGMRWAIFRAYQYGSVTAYGLELTGAERRKRQ